MTWSKPEKDTCIYALCCPFTDVVKYIGKTINGVTRMYGHWRDFRKNKFTGRLTRKQNWVKKLKNQKIKFKVMYLDYGDTEDELNAKEIYWIAKYAADGVDLLNATKGGEKCITKVFNKEECLEISRRTKLAMARPDVRANFLKGNAEKTVPKHYTKKSSEERKQKISNSEYHKKSKVKVCSSDGICFYSMNDAAKYYNLEIGHIASKLKSKYSLDNLGFFKIDATLDSITQYTNFLETYKIPVFNHNAKISVKINNLIFPSVRSAAKYLNISHDTLRTNLIKFGEYKGVTYV